MTLTFAEWQTIAFDLRVAADSYIADAHVADTSNNPRLAEQFRKQAERSRQMADRIEASAT